MTTRGPIFAMTLGALTLVAACASTPPKNNGAPPDFAVSVTVADRGRKGVPPGRARALRSARYIVEPDLLLRSAVGTGSLAPTFPPPMRQLTSAQADELWRLVESAGYLRTDVGTQIGSAETVPIAVSRPTAFVSVVGEGVRRSLQVPLETSDGAATRALVDRLAELSWIKE